MLDEIKKRRSLRAFDERPVDENILTEVFDAARWAASSMNEQPWRFVYRFKNTPEHGELFNTLSEGNRVWAGRAPVLISVLAKKNFDYRNKPNRHYLYDTGQAVATMMIELTKQGLAAHQMGGFHIEQARSVLNVNDDFEVAVIIAVGYPGDPDILPEDLRAREVAPRSRKNFDEFVFKNRMP